MKKKFTKPGVLLLAVGALLLATSLIALQNGPKLLEYAVAAPAGGLEACWQARERAMEQLEGGVSQMACAGLKTGESFFSGERGASGSLHAVDICYLETCPRQLTEGRWMDNPELEGGKSVAVLDRELAFALFGSENAVGREIAIGEHAFAIVGVTEHSRSIGEPEPYGAYIPLRTAARLEIPLETLTMYAVPAAATGLDQSFVSTMEALWGGGSFYNLQKQAMGAAMLPRLLFCAFGMAALLRLAGKLRSLAARSGERIREFHRRMYLPRLLPHAAWRILLLLLGAAALLAAVYALLAFAIEPVYSFTEWIPESLVEISALKAVFWNLNDAAAKPILIRTAESARIAFWGGLARWSAVCLLLSLALRREKESS